MNKIYKLKYDRRRNQVVAVSELTAGAGKESTGQVAALAGLTDMCSFRKLLGTLTPLAFLTGLVMSLLPGIALANPDLPTGGQIVAGQGNISTNGNQMTISQNTHGLVTNWNTFDVGQNHTVQFVQPDSSAVALNRVTGGHESQILGTLTANGQVMLVNPAGVMFGKGATVNTAGLVASTKNISNADFMAGHYTFSGGSDAGAEVVNQGNLTTTKGGFIVLAADRVKNSGNIRTPGGKTVLAAGDKVTLQLDNTGLASVSVSGSVVNALVENSGLLSATDGRVYLTARGKDMLLNTVVNNTGTVEASGLSGHGGEIVLNGGDSGVVSQSGTLLAGSKTGRGGKITVEGQNIHLAANSRTSATGKTGGGEVYVGGGWQGKDSHISNASKVVMDKSATIDVSATESGNGGTTVLWSDDYTNFRGTILAKGGAQSGNGGRVETSSYRNLQSFGDVDASAPGGQGGEWLLDPLDVTIVSGDANTSVSETGTGTEASLDVDTDRVFSPSATGAQVSAQKIADQLNAGTDVTVDSHGKGTQAGNITVNADIKKMKGTDATLTLKADGNITIGNNKDEYGIRTISSAEGAGKLGLKLLAGGTGNKGSITLGRSVNISLNGGDFYAGPAKTGMTAPSVSLEFLNNGKIQAGNITMDVAGGMTGKYNSFIAADNLTINGPVTYSTGWGVNANITAGNTLKLNAASGDITFTSTDAGGRDGNKGGGKIQISGKNGVDINSSTGKLFLNTSVGDKFGININSDDGNISLAASLGGKENDNDTALTLNNTTVNTVKGNVSIKGVSLTGKEGLTSSGLSISSGGTTELSGKSGWGRAATLSGLNLTSKDDISVAGESPGRAWSTGLKIESSTINSTAGKITLTGLANSDPTNNRKGYSKNGLEIINSKIKVDSSHGIILKGTSSVESGVELTNVILHAKKGNIDVLGQGTFTPPGAYDQRGAVTISGSSSFDSLNTRIMGTNTGGADPHSYVSPIGVTLGNYGYVNLNFSGGTVSIKGSAVNGVGVLWGVTGDGGTHVINVDSKSFTIEGKTQARKGADGVAPAGIAFINFGPPVKAVFNLKNNASVSLVGDASAANDVYGITTNSYRNQYVFRGEGNVSITGKSNDNTAVNISGIDNTGLNGSMSIAGESVSGKGVNFRTWNKIDQLIDLVNATVTGTSQSGTGIVIEASNGHTNLTSVTMNGRSDNGDGFSIEGKNLTIKDSFLYGTSKGTGGELKGNLNIARTVIKGTSTGGGNGINMYGTVEGDSPETSRVEGHSEAGNGVSMADGTEVKQVTVSGEADGDGISVDGTIKSTKSVLDGHSKNRSGVSLGENSSIDGGVVSGTSVNGAGFKAGSGSSLNNVRVTGTSVNGAGADVSSSLESTGVTTITENVTGPGTGGQTEPDDGHPDIVPPAQGGDISPVLPDSTLPDEHDSPAQDTTGERPYIHEKESVLSQPERLMNTVRFSGLRESNEPVNVDICMDNQCRKLNVGMANGPARP